ncbi:hypothetical protein J6590_007912 [Homalodisca vitripennis]|nr:hypothetical protein J6590_007912 [Homalodisca vitripennis]
MDESSRMQMTRLCLNANSIEELEKTQVEIAMALSQADFDEESFSDISTDDLESIFNEVVHLNPETFPTENGM